MYVRKTWREKMNNPQLPKVVDIPRRMQKQYGSGSMILPSAPDVEAAIRGVHKGELITVGKLRQRLAAKYATETACPLVTGIFVHIVSEAAEEDLAAGKRRVAPWWRVVGEDGWLNLKSPGGVKLQVERLRAEGHRIVPGDGKKPPRVAKFVRARRAAVS